MHTSNQKQHAVAHRAKGSVDRD